MLPFLICETSGLVSPGEEPRRLCGHKSDSLHVQHQARRLPSGQDQKGSHMTSPCQASMKRWSQCFSKEHVLFLGVTRMLSISQCFPSAITGVILSGKSFVLPATRLCN
jgi:hypothetical protein